MAEQYPEILEFAYALAEKAADMIRIGSEARWTKVSETEAKGTAVDLVTETDKAVEDMIKAAIKEKYPSHKFIGEESYAAGDKQPLTDDFTWIVDPVDGTMNFVHSNPNVGCCIGVTHQRKPVVGVIALPFFNQIFSARVGGGGFLNRTTPLPLTGGVPQPLTELSKCMFATEWGSVRDADSMGKKANSFVRLAGDPDKGVKGAVMAHALRNTGSSACNLAGIVSGHYDIYYYSGCHPWDVCAGVVILTEIGGFWHGGKEAFARDAPLDEVLMGRRYVFVRALPPSETESALEIQRRLVTELYQVIEEYTYAGLT